MVLGGVGFFRREPLDHNTPDERDISEFETACQSHNILRIDIRSVTAAEEGGSHK